MDNWLLDVQLAYGEFRTDQSAIRLNELGLGIEFTDIVNEHAVFFNVAKRRENLKKILSSDDTQNTVRTKMLALCASSDPRIDNILENLLSESAVNKDEKLKLIENCGLESFLWSRLEVSYGYTSDSPGLRDFIIQLFKSCYDMSLGNDSELYPELNPDALVFFKRWKDSVKHQAAFETLSKECADILTIEKDLQKRNISALEEIDCFELVDRKILQDAVKGAAKAMRADELMGMNKTECRELFKEHDVVYVYHDQIDATGHKKESESRVFDAAHDTIEKLIKIIKKLAAANATNLLVTSDHGFIYQDRVLEESDFLGAATDIPGMDVLYRDRRFLLGRSLPRNAGILPRNAGMKSFTAKEAGIEGDMDILS